MPSITELEFNCPKCDHIQWFAEHDARHLTITCHCSTPMKRTGQKRVDGELVQPPEKKIAPTKIVVDTKPNLP